MPELNFNINLLLSVNLNADSTHTTISSLEGRTAAQGVRKVNVLVASLKCTQDWVEEE